MPAWNPWRALRGRPHLVFARRPLPAGFDGALVATAAGPVVLLDVGLTYEERQETLTHELVHDERGLLPAGAPGWLVAKEEAAVDAEVARRLVDVGQLRRLAATLLDAAEALEAWQLAEELGVTEAVVRRRVEQLRAQHQLGLADEGGWPPPEPAEDSWPPT